MYKYYSTQRPIGPGTFPQPEGNPPLEVINYDERLPVSGEVFRAWGELTYHEPLSKADADAYELRPSRHNRDVREDVDRMAQTVGAWEKRQRVPDSKRLTWWYPDFGCYVAKEYVTPEQLAQRYQLAANWPERQKKKIHSGESEVNAMPEEQKSFYDVRKWGDRLKTGEELSISHNLYFNSHHADLTPLVAQPPAELERQITASEEKEQEIFQKLCAAVSEWEVQGAQTLLLRKAMEYVKTPAVKHTSNQWVKDNYERVEISNMVYVMRYRIQENTSYDHKLKKSVPTSWTVSWGIAFNAPKKRENPYASYQFDGQDQKRYTDKEKAEKYVQGRFKQYAHLFTEISPQIPEDKAHIFRVNGHLLPGYSVQPHVPTPQELLDFVEDQDISTLIPDEPKKPAAKQPQKKAPAKSRGDAR